MVEPLTDRLRKKQGGARRGRQIAAIGLSLGILSIIPYLGTLLWGPVYELLRSMGGEQVRPIVIGILNLLLFTGLYGGLPVGLAALVISAIGLGKRFRAERNPWMGIAGILLGLGGIAGELWFFMNKVCC